MHPNASTSTRTSSPGRCVGCPKNTMTASCSVWCSTGDGAPALGTNPMSSATTSSVTRSGCLLRSDHAKGTYVTSTSVPSPRRRHNDIQCAPDRVQRSPCQYTGPDRKERSHTFKQKVDAERWLTDHASTKAAGNWVDPKLGKILFSAYAKSWLATKSDTARSTRLNIRGRLDKHITPFSGSMAVNAVRPEHARAFVTSLVKAGLAPSTVKSIVLTTGQIFDQAVTDGLITRSPLKAVKTPSARQSEEMYFLNADQVNEVAGAVDGRYRAAVHLAAYGGLRAGELWALRVDRVDVVHGTIEIAASLSEAGGLHV